MKAFWGCQGRYFRLSLLDYLRCHQQSQDIVPCRYHQHTVPCCRHSSSQGSEIRHYQGPALKTPGAASNALGWHDQQRSPSAPAMTQAGGRVPDSTSKQSALERRLRTICPSNSATWFGKGTEWPTNCLAVIQNKTKSPDHFVLLPPPSCRPPS